MAEEMSSQAVSEAWAAGLDDLPGGSFGAGGWAPGGLGCYPRYTPEEAEEARQQFRRLIKKRFHSTIRAWKAFDADGNGRLSIFEWMRACQDMEVTAGARNLWDAFDMDRSGFISLDELDPVAAEGLGSLAFCIHTAYGNLDRAWSQAFNKRGFSFRIPFDAFATGCEMVGFPGSAKNTWMWLCTDRAHAGMGKDEFNFLSMWFEDEKPVPISPLSEKAELEQMARLPDEKDKGKGLKIKKRHGDATAEFKYLLLKTYGNYIRAWREGLDTDHSGQLDWKEFQTACKNVGYAGNRMELWKELDANGNGTVSLNELCESTAELLQGLYHAAIKRYGSWEVAWDEVFDSRGDNRVGLRAFNNGCRALGWKGDADRCFELLNMDRAKYITLETTAWIGGTEEEKPPHLTGAYTEIIGDVAISGNYRRGTRNHEHRKSSLGREHRFRLEKFDQRARSEIPFSNALAGTSPSGREFLPRRNSLEERRSSFALADLTATGPMMDRRDSATSFTDSLDRSNEPSEDEAPTVAMAKQALRLSERRSSAGDAPRKKEAEDSAMELDLSLLSHTRASKHRHDQKDMPEFPEYLASPTSAGSNAPTSPTSLWSPGRGGWCGEKERVMDATWGGGSSPLYVGSGTRDKKAMNLSRRGSQGSLLSRRGSTASLGGEPSPPASPAASRRGSTGMLSPSNPSSPTAGGRRESLPGLPEAGPEERSYSNEAAEKLRRCSVSAPSLSRWRALATLGV